MILLLSTALLAVQTTPDVGLYRTFERSIENNKTYTNKFANVELRCSYTSPSGQTIDFIGFFDGDGKGGGNATTGTIWKVRFMPDEIGQWSYTWTWSDGTTGGQGAFACVSTGVGKGIIRAYKNNPRWFAYNGTEPVWIKSYYETGHGAISQSFDWITTNVYQPLIDRGYNHLQVNWLLSLCCFDQFYSDGPAQSSSDLTLYQDGRASSTMRLDVWKMMERNVVWLNDRNIGLQMFLGFDGSRNSGPSWTDLSDSEKDFYVRYVIARLGPYANIAGWNFVWEVPGDRLASELGWAQLVAKHDVFNHLRSYQDEMPGTNEFNRPEYNFAAIENHLMFSSDRELDRPHWKEAWTHHNACLAGYVTGKPVYMVEGNSLWRRYWQAKCGATQDDLRQAAWACATAGASFTWCGHQGSGNLVAKGPQGLPFYGDDNLYAASASHIDILARVMTKELSFQRMTPQDSLLSGHDPHQAWCLAEPGQQYLVFTANGAPFTLLLASGQYAGNCWINAKTGAGQAIPSIAATDKMASAFTPPTSTTDWALILRRESITDVKVPDKNILRPSVTFNPNTVANKLTLGSGMEVHTIRIIDITGRSVYELRNSAQSVSQISIADIPPGIYILSVTSDKSTLIQKLLKK